VSAFCLGTLRDERSLPVLQTILTEFLPSHVPYITIEDYKPYIDWFFENWRPSIARLLGEWELPKFIPVLVQALGELLQQEYAVGRRTALGRAWRWSQNQIVYALGILGAFEVLREFEVSEIRYRSWKVLLAMGLFVRWQAAGRAG
jgi:HEAT repeat protein